MRPRGVFITLEGIDGAGKTTQSRALVAFLRRRGHAVSATREPGGTRLGERIRRMLLAEGRGGLAPLAELLLMYAARAQHLEQVIRPALERGDVVVSDRFNDASAAYQGYGRGLGVGIVRLLDRLICGSIRPDLTILLDLDPKTSLGRATSRETRRHSRPGRFEAEGMKFQQRVRAAYRAIAQGDPGRVRVVPANRTVADVQAELRHIVEGFLAGIGRKPASRAARQSRGGRGARRRQ